MLNSGWTLAYDDTPNEYLAAREAVDGWTDLSLSLGLWIKNDGVVADVVHGSPAFAVSLAPTMRVKSINGKPWNVGELRTAIRRAESRQTAIELVVESADVIRTVRIDYHDGLRYPHLVRDPAKPDLLGAILAPQASGASR